MAFLIYLGLKAGLIFLPFARKNNKHILKQMHHETLTEFHRIEVKTIK